MCWSTDALDCIDDVLAPLRLRVREMRRLYRKLTCPCCESRVRPGTFVVAADQAQTRQALQSRKFDRLYRREIEAFRSFLIEYPMLGARHRFGELLRKVMKRAKKTALEPRSWYHATTTLEAPVMTARTREQAETAGRYHQCGQITLYLGSDDKTAAVERLRQPKPGIPLRIAEVVVLEPLPVLDLRTPLWGEDPAGHWVLRNIVDSRFVSEPTDDSDKSRPQYRVPQYVADLARKRKFRGILYDSTRPSAYNNPEAVGYNLVLFEPIPAYDVRSAVAVEFAKGDYDGLCLDRWPLQPCSVAYQTGALPLEVSSHRAPACRDASSGESGISRRDS
jgi:hypothetical protein